MTFKNGLLFFCISAALLTTIYLALTPSSKVMANSNIETKKTNKQKMATPVVTAQAELVLTTHQIEAIGTIIANESIDITAKVSESITAIYFSSGEQVSAGQLLISLNNNDAKAALAKVNLQESQRELARIQGLVANKVVAKLEQDRLMSQRDSALAKLQQARAFVDKHKITAPFSGTLGLRQASLGKQINPGTVITTLDDLSVMKVDFQLPAYRLLELNVGQALTAKINIGNNPLYSGNIIAIDTRIDDVTRTIAVRAKFTNQANQLRPGMLANIQITGNPQPHMLLPEAAIIPIAKDKYVYLVNKKSKIERRKITIGERSRGKVVILDGLSVEDHVVIRGAFKVSPNKSVTEFTEEQFVQQTLTELSL